MVNDWMVKIVLKDSYFTISIHPMHQPFLRFMINQQHYQFTCLPFSLSCAPLVFTEVIKPILIFLQSMGVHMVVYIDNILLMAESPKQVEGHLEALIYLLTGLRFVIDLPKLITTPTQQIKYLRLLIDSITLQSLASPSYPADLRMHIHNIIVLG